MNTENNQDCQICYKIRCKGCGWEATDADVLLIQQGKMTTCPECGWRPS